MITLKIQCALAVLICSLMCSHLMSANINRKCKETRHGVDNGLVRSPDFQDFAPPNVSCSWSYSAPTGKKLLVKVDNVHLPPSELRDVSLQIYLDEQVIDIPRNCVRCLKEMVSGHSMKIIFTSNSLADWEGQANGSSPILLDIGTFQIRYKAFDPTVCDKPRTPKYGYASMVSRKVGQEIRYRCNPPYDLIGNSTAICQAGTSDHPLPDWSHGAPRCYIWNCTGGPILRFADPLGDGGAITSPGYPSYKVDVPLDCQWVISTKPGYQLSSSIDLMEFGNITDSKHGWLKIFDGKDKAPRGHYELKSDLTVNFTTVSNVMTVIFRTTKPGPIESGFFLRYSAFSGKCPIPVAPENGEVVGESYGIGSVIVYRCRSEYALSGNVSSECQSDASWSGVTPTCDFMNATMIKLHTGVEEEKIIDDEEKVEVENDLQDYPGLSKDGKERTRSKSASENSEAMLEKIPVPSPTPLLEIFTETSNSEATSTTKLLHNFDADNQTTLSTSETKMTKPSKKTRLYMTSKMATKSTPKPKGEEKKETDQEYDDSIRPSFSPLSPGKESFNKTTEDEVLSWADSSNGVMPKDKSLKPNINHGAKIDGRVGQAASVPKSPGILQDPAIDYSGPDQPKSAEDNGRDGVNHQGKNEETFSLMLYCIIGGSAAVVALLIIVVVGLFVYRKKFPVRMRFGRKFSTFENPMYATSSSVQATAAPTTGGSTGVKDKDAQHPRELKRLTA